MFRYGHHAHHPVIGIIVIVVIVALVVLGIIALVRMRRRPHGGLAASWVGMPRPPAGPSPWTGAGADSAINELRIRYARGEISSEEYWQRASVLGYAPSPGPGPGPGPSASPGPGPAAPPPPGPTPPPGP